MAEAATYAVVQFPNMGTRAAASIVANYGDGVVGFRFYWLRTTQKLYVRIAYNGGDGRRVIPLDPGQLIKLPNVFPNTQNPDISIRVIGSTGADKMTYENAHTFGFAALRTILE